MKAVKREANLWTKKQTYAKRRVFTTTIILTTTTNTTTITAKTPTAAQIHENEEKNIERSWKNNRKCSDPIVRCLYYVIFHISALSFAFFIMFFYFFPFACARMHHSIVFHEAFHCFDLLCFALTASFHTLQLNPLGM